MIRLTSLAGGLLLGASVGVGGWLAVAGVPLARRPRLDARLAPYLRDAPRVSRLLSEDRSTMPFPVLERLFRPVVTDLTGRIDRLLGGAGSVRRRLDQLDRRSTLEAFRAEQLAWGGLGLAGGLVLLAVATAARWGTSPLALLLLTVLLAVGGVVARDRWLTQQVRRRAARMTEEFPTVAELLALAVAAGEGPVAAMERLTRTGHGELVTELGRVLADTRSGSSLSDALGSLVARSPVPALARFADGIAVAVERGTPLAEVLRAQADDVREAGRRALLEVGGKKEIAMMVPVVFLVLPVTVLFALFPSIYGFTITTA